MNYDPRIWKFLADMNYDGLVTISDVWLWFKWLFFYPGDFIILYTIKILAPLATFFEISTDNYGGWLSGILSIISWLIIFKIIKNIFVTADSINIEHIFKKPKKNPQKKL
jgi:hypothetical protein